MFSLRWYGKKIGGWLTFCKISIQAAGNKGLARKTEIKNVLQYIIDLILPFGFEELSEMFHVYLKFEMISAIMVFQL